jgi:hypothetical protein
MKWITMQVSPSEFAKLKAAYARSMWSLVELEENPLPERVPFHGEFMAVPCYEAVPTYEEFGDGSDALTEQSEGNRLCRARKFLNEWLERDANYYPS